MLIFNSWQEQLNSRIYAAENDGSNLRCLAPWPGLRRYQRLRLSPQRDRLMFYAVSPAADRGQFFIWDMASDGVRVLQQAPYPNDVRWLTNDRVLCIKKDHWWTASLDEPAVVDLDCFQDFLFMDVAPDGNRILLKERTAGIGGAFYVGDIAGRAAQRIYDAEFGEKSPQIIYPSCWSPDGRTIACVGGYEDEIWLMNADGSNAYKAADGDYFWMEFYWSPDSRRIAFARTLDGLGPSSERGGLFLADLPSRQERQIAEVRAHSVWKWSADGGRVLYSERGRRREDTVALFSVAIDSQGVTELIGHAAGITNISELIVTS